MQSSSVAARPSYLSYSPPTEENNDSSNQRTTTSTSRGCTDKEPPITVVIPAQQIATTALDRPTFLLYFPKVPSRPVKVSVTEPNVTESIFEADLTVTKSGFYPVSIPVSSPGLKDSKTYVLTVGLLCNQERPSQSAYTRISFKKVALDSQTQQLLRSAKSELERARIYEKAEIWYDAIALSYKAKLASDSQAISYFNQLLERVKVPVK